MFVICENYLVGGNNYLIGRLLSWICFGTFDNVGGGGGGGGGGAVVRDDLEKLTVSLLALPMLRLLSLFSKSLACLPARLKNLS